MMCFPHCCQPFSYFYTVQPFISHYLLLPTPKNTLNHELNCHPLQQFKFYNIFVMDDYLCKCHCGTRITIDQQLLEERETWKQKYLCLQKQAANDIGRLKENIYAQCASIMQQQFSAKENQQNQVVNNKNVEIKSLTARVINLQAKTKILQKENQILKNKERELELEINDKEGLLQTLRSRGNKSERDFEVRLEQEVTLVRKRITQQYQQELQNLTTQNDHLKHKVKQFQKKYQILIPEVEKLKNTLNSKNQQVEQLQTKLQKIKKESEQQLLRIKQELDEVEKVHSKCKGTISKLSEKVESLTQELENTRKVKKQVKIQPVYIERPVQVEKVVEKIVQVEKIVNKYIEPTTFRDEEMEAENAKLKEEISHLVRQIQIFEDKHRTAVGEYEEAIKQHQENVFKYKKERQSLVKTIQEQQKELDMIHTFLERRKVESHNSQPQKIIVHVNRDGSYQKTVQRISSNNGGSAPGANRVSKKR